MREKYYHKTTRKLNPNEFAGAESRLDRRRREKRASAKGSMNLPVSAVRLLMYKPYNDWGSFFLLGEDYKWYQILINENGTVDGVFPMEYNNPSRDVDMPRMLIDVTDRVDIDQDFNKFFEDGDYLEGDFSYRKNAEGYPIRESENADEEYPDGYDEDEAIRWDLKKRGKWFDIPEERDADDLHGYVVAAKLNSALEYIADKYSETLIFLDIKVSGMSGYESQSCLWINGLPNIREVETDLKALMDDSGLPEDCLNIAVVTNERGKNRINATYYIPKVFDYKKTEDCSFGWVANEKDKDAFKVIWKEYENNPERTASDAVENAIAKEYEDADKRREFNADFEIEKEKYLRDSKRKLMRSIMDPEYSDYIWRKIPPYDDSPKYDRDIEVTIPSKINSIKDDTEDDNE